MKRKTEFSPISIRWLVALTVMTLVFAFAQEYWSPRHDRVTPFPWATAGGITIAHGLDLFSGKEPATMTTMERGAMLLGILLALVIGPTLLFFCWRRMTAGSGSSLLSPASLGFIGGGAITAFYLFGTVIVAVIHPQAAASMRSAQALGEDRDMVIAGITRVAIDAYSYKIIPKTEGGGGGSYVGYEVPRHIRKDGFGEYLQIEAADSTVTILGASLHYGGSSVRALYGPDGKMSGPFVFLGQYN